MMENWWLPITVDYRRGTSNIIVGAHEESWKNHHLLNSWSSFFKLPGYTSWTLQTSYTAVCQYYVMTTVLVKSSQTILDLKWFKPCLNSPISSLEFGRWLLLRPNSTWSLSHPQGIEMVHFNFQQPSAQVMLKIQNKKKKHAGFSVNEIPQHVHVWLPSVWVKMRTFTFPGIIQSHI